MPISTRRRRRRRLRRRGSCLLVCMLWVAPSSSSSSHSSSSSSSTSPPIPHPRPPAPLHLTGAGANPLNCGVPRTKHYICSLFLSRMLETLSLIGTHSFVVDKYNVSQWVLHFLSVAVQCVHIWWVYAPSIHPYTLVCRKSGVCVVWKRPCNPHNLLFSFCCSRIGV